MITVIILIETEHYIRILDRPSSPYEYWYWNN